MKPTFLAQVIWISALAALTACGGGGGSSEVPANEDGDQEEDGSSEEQAEASSLFLQEPTNNGSFGTLWGPTLTEAGDEFLLATGGSVGAVRWWGGSASGPVTVSFYRFLEPSGVPDTLPEASFEVEEVEKVSTSIDPSHPDQDLTIFEYTAILPEPIQVEAGQPYLLGISRESGWSWYESVTNGGFWNQLSDGSWKLVPVTDLALELLSESGTPQAARVPSLVVGSLAVDHWAWVEGGADAEDLLVHGSILYTWDRGASAEE